MASEQFQISCKNLGALAEKDACPRCFWLSMHCDIPYQFFPGIFSSIDSYTKKITNNYYLKHHTNAPWFFNFGELGEPLKVPHFSKFCLVDDETNIKLTGVPDEIFKRPDGSHFIADYKTARFTGAQGAMMAIYKVQLNGYAYLAEHVGFSPVGGIGLVYFEPQTEINPETVDTHSHDKGFLMHFHAKLVPLELDTSMIRPLLKTARVIYDKPSPPEGAHGCKDCEAIDTIVKCWGRNG